MAQNNVKMSNSQAFQLKYLEMYIIMQPTEAYFGENVILKLLLLWNLLKIKYYNNSFKLFFLQYKVFFKTKFYFPSVTDDQRTTSQQMGSSVGERSQCCAPTTWQHCEIVVGEEFYTGCLIKGTICQLCAWQPMSLYPFEICQNTHEICARLSS